MAIYRNIQMSFWTDSKVVDEFTPEDRYFYLYLITNPHTNLAGCYEISVKQASDETGYTKDVILNLLERFEHVHNVIRYSKETKEVLLLNWSKFNWTRSKDFQKPLNKEIELVKNIDFKRFLQDSLDGVETVPRPSSDGVGTTDTVTVTVTDTDKDINNKNIKENKEEQKKSYGESGNVKLTEKQYNKLVEDYGEEETKKAIEYLDGYIADRKYKSEDNNRALRRWVFDAVKEQEQKRARIKSYDDKPGAGKPKNKFNQFPQNNYDFNELEEKLLDN